MRPSVPHRLTLAFLLGLLAPHPVLAQETPTVPPVPPAVESTTNRNPRGADIVEPMRVLQVTRYADGRSDTTDLGLAKIPDPRRGEVGAITRQDVDGGALIRLADAWIFDEGGLPRTVELDPEARSEELLFLAGPHDEVVSRQGVPALMSLPGRVTAFDLRSLYRAADVNPLTGRRLDGRSPRLALLAMRSTFPGGEAVDLAVPLSRGRTPLVIRRLERRDTTVLRPQLVLQPPDTMILGPERLSLLALLESGYGSSVLYTGIPATTRAPFTTSGYADAYYVEGALLVDRLDHRWRLDVHGASSVANTGVTEVNDHLVALRAALRFEYGRRDYLVLQAAGLMADKQFQEFDWNSADYAGMLLAGRGRRAVDALGIESRRLEGLVGLRMGEHREIEVFESRQRARGIGPMLAATYRRLHRRPGGAEFYLAARARAYGLLGRGDRDEGFRELGARLEGEATLGREMIGLFVYATVTATARTTHAWLPDDYHYLAYRAYLVPGLGIQMRL